MRNGTQYLVKVIAVGVITLISVSVLLAWPRKLCDNGLQVIPLAEGPATVIQPSGLTGELDRDPKVDRMSAVRAYPKEDGVLYGWGLFDEVDPDQARYSRMHRQHVIRGAQRLSSFEPVVYFDKERRVFVQCEAIRVDVEGQKPRWAKKVHAYAGPDGMAERPDEGIGEFGELIHSYFHWPALLVFDKDRRRFFRIDFGKGTVSRGPQLAVDGQYNPIQIDQLTKHPRALRLYWSAPAVKKTVRLQRHYRRKYVHYEPIKKNIGIGRPHGGLALVLDASGRIDKLNVETLEFAGPAGYLPITGSYFYTSPSLKHLFSYRAWAFLDDKQYKGLIAGSLSGDGTGVAIAVFDENGKRLAEKSTVANIDESPAGVGLVVGKFLFENLHPPVLNIVSYLTVSRFEGVAAHRTLFLLPNSFAGGMGKDLLRRPQYGVIERCLYPLLFVFASILFGVFLAWRVGRDAAAVGLPKRTRMWWRVATIAFGLSAYITYRLTRPRITRVTCVNCGKLRRPDMTNCHHCGSGWHVPELTPPAWRITEPPLADESI